MTGPATSSSTCSWNTSQPRTASLPSSLPSSASPRTWCGANRSSTRSSGARSGGGFPKKRPVQARRAIHHHPGLLAGEPVVPGQDGVPQVPHDQHRDVVLHPAVDQGVADAGREPIQCTGAPEQVLTGGRPAEEPQGDVGARRDSLDHQLAPVGQPDPLQPGPGHSGVPGEDLSLDGVPEQLGTPHDASVAPTPAPGAVVWTGPGFRTAPPRRVACSLVSPETSGCSSVW